MWRNLKEPYIDNDRCIYAILPCDSSLGKRKVDYIGRPDIHPSELSINLSTSVVQGLEAICRIYDEQGRELGLRISQQSLQALYVQLGKAIEAQQALEDQYGRNQR